MLPTETRLFRKYLSYRRAARQPSAFSRYAGASLEAVQYSPWCSSRSRAGAKTGAAQVDAVDWRTIQARWDEYRHAARRRWAKLSEQELHGTRGNRAYLAKRVQEAYWVTREEAERQVAAWQAHLPGGWPAGSAP